MKKMERVLRVGLLLIVFMALSTTAMATVFTTSSSDVFFSVSDGGYFVKSAGISGTNASSSIVGSNFHLSASGAGYSDAGIVLYFNGGLKLGDLQDVSIASTGSPLAMNLWLDTGGNGTFFAFDATDALTGLNGDSYGGHNGNSHDTASPFYMLGGNGAGSTHTLAELQAGDVSGIGLNTPTALWIGITNSGGSDLSADISSITVSTVSAPEPATMLLLGLGLMGIAGIRRRLS